MRGNTIQIELPLKRGKVSKTIPLYQYDYGQNLVITGATLPSAYEVHFANEMHGEAVTSIGGSTGVAIPDSVLTSGEPIYLWLYLHEDSADGETEFQGVIPVIKRASISDQEPTPAEQSAITEAIAALNAAVTATSAAETAAESAASQIVNMSVAAETASGSSPTVTKGTDGSGNVRLTFGLVKGDKGAKGDPGDPGSPGNPGADGEDGVSPSVSVTDISGGHRVSITDASGTETFDVMDGEDADPVDFVADEFSEESTYAVGDYVMHNGKLYECSTEVSTAGEWDSDDWTETQIADELSNVKSEIAKKADKTYNPNLNLDPYYTNVGTGIPQLDPKSNWGFSNTSEVYSVANGKLTYTQSDTNDKLYKAVSLINGHDYYYYLDVTGSGSMVLHFAGYYTGEKYDNDYIEKSFTCGLTTGATYAQIRAKSTTSYTLGLFVLLDLTALGITLEEAKKLKDAIKKMSVINVMDYGAKGDGVTDDTDAIAEAVKVCPPGGTVFIPGGTYLIKNIACKSNMSVKGEGRATVLSMADNVTVPSSKSYNCLTVKSVSNVYISDLTIDGNRTNNSAPSSVVDADDSFNCIGIVHSDHVFIDNVWGHSAGYHGVIMVDVHHIEVKNSKFWDNGFRPIHGHSTVNDVKVINNEVWANGQGFEGVSHGAYDAIFFFDDVHRLEISDNYIHDSTNIGGIQIGGNYVGDGDPSSDIMIVGNIIKNRNLEDDTKSQYGIHIMGDCVTNLSILNNSITGDRGIFMNNYHDRGANKNVSIIGNTIYNCKTYGIYVTEAYYDCIVSNNQIVGGTQAGMQIEKNEKLTITGNVVVDYERGIHIKNGTDVVISSNVVERRGQSAPAFHASIKADDTNTNVWMIYNIVGIAVINSGTGAVTLPSS